AGGRLRRRDDADRVRPRFQARQVVPMGYVAAARDPDSEHWPMMRLPVPGRTSVHRCPAKWEPGARVVPTLGVLTCMAYVVDMKNAVTLHDGATIDIEVSGDGPNLILPVNPIPIEDPQTDEMRKWGADPALGRNLVDGLADIARVIAVDYEGHVLATPKPETLTPANVVAD